MAEETLEETVSSVLRDDPHGPDFVLVLVWSGKAPDNAVALLAMADALYDLANGLGRSPELAKARQALHGLLAGRGWVSSRTMESPWRVSGGVEWVW